MEKNFYFCEQNVLGAGLSKKSSYLKIAIKNAKEIVMSKMSGILHCNST